MYKQRIALLFALFLLLFLRPSVVAQEKQSAPETITGSIVAHGGAIRADRNCHWTIIVRTTAKGEDHQETDYIVVRFDSECTKGIPEQHLNARQRWRFSLIRNPDCDEVLENLLYFAQMGPTGGVMKEKWLRLLPDVEAEKIPADKKLPCYFLGPAGFDAFGSLSIIQTSFTKSQSANSNNASPKSPNESQSRTVHEPSRDELERLIPSTVRRRMRCSIAEDVTAKHAEGVPALTVSFDASASIAPCGKIIKWIWDFGDGTSGKGSKVKHTYRRPGDYIVNLDLADKKCNTNYVQLDYVVRVSPGQPVQLKVRSGRHVSPHKTSKPARKD